jgi:methyl-accepting chemotaxis protein
MTQQTVPNKRGQYFIEKGFQFHFIVKFCLLLLAGILLSTALLFLFSQGTLTSSFQHSRLEIKSTAMSILPALLYTNLITLLIVSAAAIAVTLFVSHKIAGPMYRIEQGLAATGRGDLTHRISFRRKDQMQGLADSFNHMSASLSDKISAIDAEAESLEKLAAELGLPDHFTARLSGLRAAIRGGFRAARDEEERMG